MTLIEHVPNGPALHISRARVAGVKADWVKQVVRITLDLPLDDESLALRQQLAVLADETEDQPASISIQPMQVRVIHEETDEFQMTMTYVGPGGEVLREIKPGSA